MEKRQPLGILQEGHDLASTLKARLAELEAVLHRPSQPDESAALEERLVEQSVEFERRRARFRRALTRSPSGVRSSWLDLRTAAARTRRSSSAVFVAASTVVGSSAYVEIISRR